MLVSSLGDLGCIATEEVRVNLKPLPRWELSLTIGIQLLKNSERTAQLAFRIGAWNLQEVDDMHFSPVVIC